MTRLRSWNQLRDQPTQIPAPLYPHFSRLFRINAVCNLYDFWIMFNSLPCLDWTTKLITNLTAFFTRKINEYLTIYLLPVSWFPKCLSDSWPVLAIVKYFLVLNIFLSRFCNPFKWTVMSGFKIDKIINNFKPGVRSHSYGWSSQAVLLDKTGPKSHYFCRALTPVFAADCYTASSSW